MKDSRTIPAVLALSALLAACEGGEGEASGGVAGQGETARVPAAQVTPPQSVAGPGSPFDDPVGRMPGLIPEPPEIDNPYDGDVDALHEGRTLFVAYNCYGCHGGHGGGGMGPSLRDDTWIYGEKAIDIFDSIAEGRPHSMPAWQAMLPAEIIWKMTAYIQSMRTDQEPDAPRPRTAGDEDSQGAGSEGAPAEAV